MRQPRNGLSDYAGRGFVNKRCCPARMVQCTGEIERGLRKFLAVDLRFGATGAVRQSSSGITISHSITDLLNGDFHRVWNIRRGFNRRTNRVRMQRHDIIGSLFSGELGPRARVSSAIGENHSSCMRLMASSFQ